MPQTSLWIKSKHSVLHVMSEEKVKFYFLLIYKHHIQKKQNQKAYLLIQS